MFPGKLWVWLEKRKSKFHFPPKFSPWIPSISTCSHLAPCDLVFFTLDAPHTPVQALARPSDFASEGSRLISKTWLSQTNRSKTPPCQGNFTLVKQGLAADSPACNRSKMLPFSSTARFMSYTHASSSHSQPGGHVSSLGDAALSPFFKTETKKWRQVSHRVQ